MSDMDVPAPTDRMRPAASAKAGMPRLMVALRRAVISSICMSWDASLPGSLA